MEQSEQNKTTIEMVNGLSEIADYIKCCNTRNSKIAGYCSKNVIQGYMDD